MPTKSVPLVTVECGTCHICCKNQVVWLSLEHGDDPSRYDTVTGTGPSGDLIHMLRKKPNGDCIYLGEQGCTIHPNHPAMCRAFDCADLYSKLPRSDRKKLVAEGKFSQEILDAGRQRARAKREKELSAASSAAAPPAASLGIASPLGGPQPGGLLKGAQVGAPAGPGVLSADAMQAPIQASSAGASPPAAKVGSIDFWRAFAPDLHIADSAFLARYSGIAISPAQQEHAAQQIRQEGYIQANVDWGLDFVRMAECVRSLSAAGLSPVFAFLYDEFWVPFYRLHFVISGLLGGRYFMLPDFWVWNVDPDKGESGWKAHRDKNYEALFPDGSPKCITTWIPLSKATPLNSCMYIVPAMLDPTYGTENDKEYEFEYSSIRALPAQPGDFFIWNQAVVHWGSQSSVRGATSRVSMGFEFQRADVRPYRKTIIEPLSLLTFEQRLKLIAKQILQYEHMYAVDPQVKQFAQDLLS